MGIMENEIEKQGKCKNGRGNYAKSRERGEKVTKAMVIDGRGGKWSEN